MKKCTTKKLRLNKGYGEIFYPAKENSMCGGGGKLSGPLSDRIRILTFLCFLIGFDTDLLRLTKYHILFFIKIDPQKKKIISVKC